MPAAQGFIVNTAAVAGLTTTYALARIVTLSGTDALALAIDSRATTKPQGGYWSHLELNFTETVAVPASCTFHLTWDAAGDIKASAEATITLVSGITTVARWGGASGLDVWPNANGNSTAGVLYLWIRTNAGTVTLNTARLYWRDNLGG
jgi:hypothetical protein